MKTLKNCKSTILLSFFLLFSYSLSFSQNNGPNAPEAAGFEAVDASDMVNLVTGDISYVLPLFTVPSPEGGYPINLSYHAGISYEQESSWIGLGWNLNPGSINRNINGYPDDWNGGIVRDVEAFYYKSQEVTVGVSDPSGAIDVGIGVNWDSNKSWGGFVSIGVGWEDSGTGANASLGFQKSSSGEVNFNASIGMSIGGFGIGVGGSTDGSGGIGVGFKDKGSGIGMNMGIGTSGISGGISYGKTNAEGYAEGTSIGLNFSSNGVSVSVGSGNGTGSVKGATLSFNNTSSIGISLIVPLGFINITFGYKQTTIKNHTIFNYNIYGPLYFSNNNIYSAISSPENSNDTFQNYQSINNFMDVYEQNIPPINESDIISFEELEDKEKPSFVFPSYDLYQVNAQGISGTITPRLFENGTLLGQGKDIEIAADSPDKFYTNYHYGVNHRFTKTANNTNQKNRVNFYFDNLFGNNVSVEQQLNSSLNTGSNIDNYLTSKKIYGLRAHSSNYVTTILNKDIATTAGVLEACVDDHVYNRTSEPQYVENGIGGYQITTSDGKTYHYMLPVYHYEEIQRTILSHKISPFDKDYRESRKITPYATHWLLTAITGPDFVKNTPEPYPTEGDYGYWVRFDYGKWTDGYMWRSPYEDYFYMTYKQDDTKKSMREFSFGRKQLVYLDKIVTRTHTALFVKSVRQDAKGAEIRNIARNKQEPTAYEDTNLFTETNYLSSSTNYYPKENSLKLDEIILVRNQDLIINNGGTNSGTVRTVKWGNLTPGTISYNMSHLDKVLDKSDLNQDPNIYEKALKVIRFDNNAYELAIGTPSTENDGGRLTLKGLEILGKSATSFLPKYEFSYINKLSEVDPSIIPNSAADDYIRYHKSENFEDDAMYRDSWGYYKGKETAWSLKEIKTPTGGKIKIKYQKDDYYTEAFTRRYWKNGLDFKITRDGTDAYLIQIREQCNISPQEIDFRDYFEKGRPVSLDLWIGFRHDYESFLSWNSTCAIFDLRPNTVLPIVTDVQERALTLKIQRYLEYGDLITTWCHSYSGDSEFLNDWFSIEKDCNSNSHGCDKVERNTIPEYQAGGFGDHDRHHMYYGIVANKVPGEDTSGGLRVYELTVSDENGNNYTTQYDYKFPGTQISSGITPFAPVRGTKYVPYQTELPPPRVMYEYVTVKSLGNNNEYLGYSRYHFNTLKPVENIFNPNLSIDGIFKAVVEDWGEINSSQKIYAVRVNLFDNTASLGTLLSFDIYNKQDQLISSKKTNLLDYNLIGTSGRPQGVYEESFNSLKSVWRKETDYLTYIFHTQKMNLKKRLLNASSKTIYPLMVENTEDISGNNKTLTWQENWDSILGRPLDTKTQMSDGTYVLNRVIPAFKFYSDMGSKVDNVDYKNMLTQEAMNITFISPDNVNWKTSSAKITTWKNIWTYRDPFGEETTPTLNSKKVWRKHKDYVWKDDIYNSGYFSGAYITDINETNNYFNWGVGIPSGDNDKWQKISEITRYTNWSLPIEGTDINNNYIASKMADNFSKTIVSGNARYTEIYYSGAENIISNGVDSIFEGEIEGVEYRSSDVSHTGTYSLMYFSSNSKLFRVTGEVGSSFLDTSKKFRPGKYKISIWAYNNYRDPWNNLALMLNGYEINYDNYVTAGNWTQFNYIIEMAPNTNIELYFTYPINNNYYKIPEDTLSTNPQYIDDFRMSPISSSVNSYVYDKNTDELIYILNSNNLATRYVYDKAGRLCKVYTEVVNEGSLIGGFKLKKENKYHYKGKVDLPCPCEFDDYGL